MSTSGMHRRPFEGRHLVLQASIAHFHREDTLQPKLGTKYFQQMYL